MSEIEEQLCNEMDEKCKIKDDYNTKINSENIQIIQKKWKDYICRKKIRLNNIIDILKKLEWSKLLKLYEVFGDTLNGNDMKALKGKLYEIFISESSNNFKHVDISGCDIKCLLNNIKIECKFQINMLLTNKSRILKKILIFVLKIQMDQKKC